MRGEVDVARRLQRIGEGLPADRLQGVADGAFGVAVVDDQRGAVRSARRGGRSRARSGPRAIRRSRRSARCAAAAAASGRTAGSDRGRGRTAAAVVGDLDHALVPAVDAHHRLMHRQRVEELVGEDDGRAVRHLGRATDATATGTSDAGQRLPLPLLQRRADLDQMHDQRLAEIRHDLHRAQRVEHHGAAAGPELDQPHVLRRAHRPPGRGAHSPISSPNIWLISGAVMKSPLAPNGSRVM